MVGDGQRIVCLVRHGESEANLDDTIAGHFDSPLTELGIAEAAALGQKLRDIKFDYGFHSTLQRTRKTLDGINSVRGRKIGVIKAVNALRERNWGEYEGQKHGAEHSAIISTWEGQPRGGESYDDMDNRVFPFILEEVFPLIRGGSNLLLVSHNGVGKTIRRRFEDADKAQIGELGLRNCEAVIYHFNRKLEVVHKEHRYATE